jgi:hypothetical protein
MSRVYAGSFTTEVIELRQRYRADEMLVGQSMRGDNPVGAITLAADKQAAVTVRFGACPDPAVANVFDLGEEPG